MKYFFSFAGVLILLSACGSKDGETTSRGSLLIATPGGAFYAASCLNQKKALKTLTESTAQDCAVDTKKLEALNPSSNKRNMYYYKYWYYVAYIPNYGYNGATSFCRNYFNTGSCLGMNPIQYTPNPYCTYQSLSNWWAPYQRSCSYPAVTTNTPSTPTTPTNTIPASTSGYYYYPTPYTAWNY